LRLREAAKLGFELACGPEDVGDRPEGLRYHGLDRLPKLVDRIMADQ
jgi:DNA repair protein RadA/Sms